MPNIPSISGRLNPPEPTILGVLALPVEFDLAPLLLLTAPPELLHGFGSGLLFGAAVLETVSDPVAEVVLDPSLLWLTPPWFPGKDSPKHVKALRRGFHVTHCPISVPHHLPHKLWVPCSLQCLLKNARIIKHVTNFRILFDNLTHLRVVHNQASHQFRIVH